MSERKGGDQRPTKRDVTRHGRTMERREFLGWLTMRTAAVFVGTAALSGGAAWYIFDHLSEGSTPHNDVDVLIAQYKGQERQMEPVVARFEKGYKRFSKLVATKLAVSDISAEGKRTLGNPFEIASINHQNTERNVYTLKLHDLEKRRVLGTGQIRLTNPNFFFFDALPPGADIAAAYVPLMKIMYISPDYDPDNLLDNLIVTHELVHIGQDNRDRQELPADYYNNFFGDTPSGSKTKAIGIYEATAYAIEIYLLNLLTDGQLKKDVFSERMDVAKYRSLLKFRPSQNKTFYVAANMAYSLYRSGTSLEGIGEQFLNYVCDVYRREGAVIYDRTPTGFVRVP